MVKTVCALILMILTGCSWSHEADRNSDPEPSVSRPPSFDAVLGCSILPVFIQNEDFLIGHVLQEPPTRWLPDLLIWKPRNRVSISGKRGESRTARFTRNRFGNLQTQLGSIIAMNLEIQDLQAVEVTMEDIVVHTIDDPILADTKASRANKSRPYVRTLVKAESVRIRAILHSHQQASLGFYQDLIPAWARLSKLSAENQVTDKGVVFAEQVYFEACVHTPPLDISNERLLLVDPSYKDSFRIRNQTQTPIDWRCDGLPEHLFVVDGANCGGVVAAGEWTNTIPITRRFPLRKVPKIHRFSIISSSPHAELPVIIETDNKAMIRSIHKPEPQ